MGSSLPARAASALAIALFGWVAMSAVGQTHRFPELTLDAASIHLDLAGADLLVVSDASAAPVIRAWFTDQGSNRRPATVLEKSLSDAVMSIQIGGDSEASADSGRLLVEVTVGAGQRLVVTGTGLDITAREVMNPGTTDPLGVQYDVESSRLDLHGGKDFQVHARQSSAWIEASRGVVNLQTVGGTVEVKDHDGEMEIVSAATEVTLSGSGPKLDCALDGGSLFLNGGTGSLVVGALETVVVIEQWQGTVEVTGADSTIEARDGGTAGAKAQAWAVSGLRQDVRLENLTGRVSVILEGGRLDASNLSGELTAEARDLATLEVSGLEAKATIGLLGGSDLTIREAGAVDLNFDDGLARVYGIGRLDVAGSRAQLEGDTIERIGRMELMESRIELNLETLQHDAVLQLTGPGDIRLDLKAPCVLRLSGADASVIDSVSVSGCELRAPGLPAGQTRMREIYGDLPPRTLTLNLQGDVQVEADGRP